MRRVKAWMAIGAALILTFQLVVPAAAGTTQVAGISGDDAEDQAQDHPEGASGLSGTYSAYMEKYGSVSLGGTAIELQAKNHTGGRGLSEAGELDGVADAWIVSEDGFIEWTFEVPADTRYNLLIRYYPVKGKGSSIEREVYINGEIPFNEAGSLVMKRTWKDEGEKKVDSLGNDIRPNQVEERAWTDYMAVDSSGSIAEYLSFYFSKGENTLRLASTREPVAIQSVTLTKAAVVPTYDELMAGVSNDDPLLSAGKVLEPIQAEDCSGRSDMTIYPISDKTSYATVPQSASVTKLNTIGAGKWQTAGQWIRWDFYVEETGYYKIAPRFRQNIYTSGYTSRRLTIDDKVPFKEAENLKFDYSKNWQTKFLGDGEDPYLFYLEKGPHSMKLEVVLGDMAGIITRLDAALNELNAIYRKILMIVGPDPDVYRDYSFDKLIPGEIVRLGEQAAELQDICGQMKRMAGTSGEYTAVLEKLVFQLEQMNEKPSRIANNFKDFKTNIGSLGTCLLALRQQPLELDYFVIQPADDDTLPRGEAAWYQNLWLGIEVFLQSFVRDYNAVAGMGGDETPSETIKVWIATGRDQAQIIRTLADDSFSPRFSAAVDLQLTAAGTLLPATLAGIGPDVSLSTDGTYPVNFAVRKGVVDLAKFPDFDEVAARFHSSALVPYTYKGSTYALPETQSFPMLFYRKDVFEELDLAVPDTWDDLYAIIPELKKNNMDIGFPTSYAGFMLLLYQRGGELYINEGERSNLNADQALDAFQELCDLFTQYSFPAEYDFANRFRIGEMPLGIQDYTMYNTLTVSAPEIKGMWDFTVVPGYVGADGAINRSVPGTGLAVMMMNGVQNEELAWEFMKWWTSAEVQAQFGREMESVLGASAKQPTANLEAVEQLPWTTKEYSTLHNAWEHVRGVPEVPGSYYTQRNIDFAFSGVYNKKLRPVDTLLTYIDEINRELTRKRMEFGIE